MAIDLGNTPTGTPPTAGEKLQIRSAIGVGTTDAPAFAGLSTTGNAGIGTATPASGLHVAGLLGTNTVTYDSAAALKLTNTSGGSWLVTSGVIGVANAHFSIRQESVSQPAIVVTGTGNNVGIGINAPTAKLDISDIALSGSGSLAGSALNIAQTWNTTGTPTALKLNVTETASNFSSLLLDCQTGGTSRFRVTKNGAAVAQTVADNGGVFSAGSNGFKNIQFGGLTYNSNGMVAIRDPGLVVVRDLGGFCWENGTQNPATGTIELSLFKDAPGILAQRNGVNAQAFRVYNTFPGTTANEWFEIDWKTTANTVRLFTNHAGTGGARSMDISAGATLFLGAGSSSPIRMYSGGVERWNISATGHFLAATDNAHDIGASGANRPKTIYAGTSMSSPTFVSSGSLSAFGSNTQVAGTLHVGYTGSASASLYAPSNGVLLIGNVTANDFGRLQLGGTTSAFPAIKRNGTGIEIRFADDSSYTTINASDYTGYNGGVAKMYAGGAGVFQAVSTGYFALSSSATNVFSGDTYLSRSAAGVWQMGTSSTNATADLRLRSVIQQPPATVTPVNNGDFVVEATSNTLLTFKFKGSDGTIRSGTMVVA